MKDDRVQAATGMILVRNWYVNFLSRLTDINVVTSCLLFRMARSWLGIVSPTSGALAIYRSDVVYDNLEDYLTSGTAGDDRRLSFYALLRGQVVGVTEAIVSTAAARRRGGPSSQRMRWSKSAWLGTGFVLTNLRWLVVIFYMFPLAFTLHVAVRRGGSADALGPLRQPGVLVRRAVVGGLLDHPDGCLRMYRPGFTRRQRWTQWALSPVYPVMGLIILRPAAYWALTKLKSTSWHTRENAPVVSTGVSDEMGVPSLNQVAR